MSTTMVEDTLPIASNTAGGTMSGSKEANPRARDHRPSKPHHADDAGGTSHRRRSGASMQARNAGSAAHRQVIGNYELGRVLATGDFDCRTRLCRHITTGVRYVVRVYDKRVLEDAQWMWNRVAESIRVQRTLPKNTNILEMVECFESNTSVYMLMHLFPSLNITKLFTDPAARSRMLRGLQNMPQDLVHSSTAATSTGSLTTEPEKTEKGAPHRQLSRLRMLQVTDPTSPITAQASTLIAPSEARVPKRVSSRWWKKSMGAPSASAAESQPSRHGTGASAAESGISLRDSSKQGSTPRTAVSTIVGAGTSATAVPSHVPLSLIRDLFEQAVKGVMHLHQYNVAHTGIAPDHLLVGTNGLLRISNMVSCCFCAQGDRLHELRGTRHTVAPEVLRGESYDPYLVDAWALGVVLYFMLNRGRYPHDGASTLRHILHGRMRPSRPGLPPVALDLVSRLLQASPEERLPVDAILAHPFFSARFPTIAEAAAAEAAERPAQNVRHTLPPSSSPEKHNAVGSGDNRNGCRLCDNEDTAGAGRQEASSPCWESLVTFGSDNSLTGRDAVNSPELNPQPNDEGTSAPKDGSRRGGRDTVSVPQAGLSTCQRAAAQQFSSPPMKRARQAALSLDTDSPHESAGGSVSVPPRPVWCPELAPSLNALEDLAARVIQYRYRHMKHRQQYQAETRALVTRGQSMRRARAEEEGIGGPVHSLLDVIPTVVLLPKQLSVDLGPLSTCAATPKHDEVRHRQRQRQQQQSDEYLMRKSVAANVLNAAADPQPSSVAHRRIATNNSVDTGALRGNKSLLHWHKPGTSLASASQSVHVTEANNVVIHTSRGSSGSLNHNDDNQESSLISNLDVAPRTSLPENGDAITFLGTAPQESLKLPVPLPLNQRQPSNNARVCSSAANSTFIAPHKFRRSFNSTALPMLTSLHGCGGSVGVTADRSRVGEELTVKDNEKCPLCHREPYTTRVIGTRPYGCTSYVYVDGKFTKVVSA